MQPFVLMSGSWRLEPRNSFEPSTNAPALFLDPWNFGAASRRLPPVKPLSFPVAQQRQRRTPLRRGSFRFPPPDGSHTTWEAVRNAAPGPTGAVPFRPRPVAFQNSATWVIFSVFSKDSGNSPPPGAAGNVFPESIFISFSLQRTNQTNGETPGPELKTGLWADWETARQRRREVSSQSDV